MNSDTNSDADFLTTCKVARQKLFHPVTSTMEVIFLRDEKNFSIDIAINWWNTRYEAKKLENIDPSLQFIPKSKHPAKPMMLWVIGSDGFHLPPILVDGHLDGKQYRHLLLDAIIPTLN